jgi:hypothetical protein
MKAGGKAMIATTVPVTIEPDAAEQIDKLGLRVEFECILDHVLLTTPNLTRLEVTFPPNYEEPNETVVVEAFGDWEADEFRDCRDGYFRWVIKKFPPEASYYIHLSFCPVANNGPKAIS